MSMKWQVAKLADCAAAPIAVPVAVTQRRWRNRRVTPQALLRRFRREACGVWWNGRREPKATNDLADAVDDHKGGPGLRL